MDGLNIDPNEQREWFIYLNDRPEGPLSAHEVLRRIDLKQLVESDFVWADGMERWALVAETRPFGLETPMFPPPFRSARATVAPSLNSASSRAPLSVPRAQGEKRQKNAHFASVPKLVARNQSNNLLLRILALLAVIAALLTLSITWSRYQQPKRYLKALETARITDDEKRRLRAANAEKPLPGAPAWAIAVQDSTSPNPRLVLATNLPDGVRLTLKVYGEPETLLERWSFEASQELIVADGLALSTPLHGRTETALPLGNYRLSVLGADGRLIGEESVFLGGIKNQDYDDQLKLFHEQLRAEANTERNDLKQLIDTLESQLSSTNNQFMVLLHNPPNSAQKAAKAWARFAAEWVPLQNQLEKMFNSWEAHGGVEKLFYSKQFSEIRTVSRQILEIHLAQNRYIGGNEDPDQTELEILKKTKISQSRLFSLRTEIELADKIPPTANGMPRRDGS